MNDNYIQLKKGVIGTLILKLLSRERMYGYQIMQELDVKSRGTFRMKEGTLYPVLYRLEDSGLISSEWEKSSGGSEKHPVPRKYYSINPRGKEELVRLTAELDGFMEAINRIIREDEQV